jgi:multidrug efflux system membrane fusion protein
MARCRVLVLSTIVVAFGAWYEVERQSDRMVNAVPAEIPATVARTLGKDTLLLIVNMADQASATMRLKAMFANEDEQHWPGDLVNARVSVEVLHDALTVPSAAIQLGPEGIFAWLLAGGYVVQARPITPGPTISDRTTITLGLTKGEHVVVNGQYELRQNSKVTVALPAPAVGGEARAS